MSKTASLVRQILRGQGKSLPAWAREHGFPVRAVRAVVYGHNKGHFGQSHRIAIALGLKEKSE